MFETNKDQNTSTLDFRMKVIEVILVTIASFSIASYTTTVKDLRYSLASFALLIIFQVIAIIAGSNKLIQEKTLPKGVLDEDITMRHFSYSLNKLDHIGLAWYSLTILASLFLILCSH